MKKAIVNSGSRKIIGEVIVGNVDEQDLKDTEAVPGKTVTIKDAWELRCDMFLVPTGQGPVAMHKNSCVPLDAEEDAVSITARIDNIRWFDDMEDRGRKYDLLIEEIKEVMVQTRANRAGIQTAKQSPPQSQEENSGIIL